MRTDNLIWTAGGAVAGAVILFAIGLAIDFIPIVLAIVGLLGGGSLGLSMAPSTGGGNTDAQFGN